jgi:uncharacterized membrane protein YjjP (DUF1212 family)
MSVSPALALKLISTSIRILFVNGQTTYRIVEDAVMLGRYLGYSVSVHPAWDQFIIRLEPLQNAPHDNGFKSSSVEVIAVTPLGVDMHKVSQALAVLADIRAGLLPAEQAVSRLNTISIQAPASTLRFVIMAGLGAAALAVIFGVADLLTLLLTFCSASAGAALRRVIARYSHNAYIQPLAASFLAGLVGALLHNFQIGSTLQLIEVCPCMILVPGAHIINGSLDLARGRLSLGMARLTYSGLIVLMICLGLLLGLWVGGQTLAPALTGQAVPLILDMLSACVAVAAFGTFFSMPWRVLVIPMLIGALAHAIRWNVIETGQSIVIGAAAACFFAGMVSTPLAHKLNLPFAALAFASVVSMMPGVFLFRIASTLLDIYNLGGQSSQTLLGSVISDAMAAAMISLAIAFGLIVPKLALDHYFYKD